MDQPGDKLEVLTGTWLDLQPHAERGGLFWLDPEYDLPGTALKMAGDDVEEVKRLLDGGALRRPPEDLLQRWNQTPALEFRFVIVQPYVLIQELGH